MQVDDDGEEGGELIHFSEEDIRDYVGEMERPRVFADTLQALVQQADEPLSGRWESKLQEKKNGVEELQRLYVNLIRYIILCLSICHIVGKECRSV